LVSCALRKCSASNTNTNCLDQVPVALALKLKPASARGTRSKCFKPLISIILIGISNPAKTDSGIYAANEPKPKYC
jgi:hypothetical protein